MGRVRTGWATYYCCTRGYGSAKVVALAGWHYVPKGRDIKRWVRVCVTDTNPFKSGKQPGICKTFPAVDYCGCGRRHGLPTVVDLSLSARDALLLDPGMGYYGVRITILVEK